MENKQTDQLAKSIEDIFNSINPILKSATGEIKKLQTPKKQKNLKIDIEDVVVSLIEDGRVVIKFATLDSADAFYTACDGIEKEKSGFFKKLFKKHN